MSQDNILDGQNQKGNTNEQKSKRKMREQNIQLHKQIFELQKQVNEVLIRKQANKIKNQEVQKQLFSFYGEQIQEQQKKIKRLKQKVYYLKSSNAKMNVEYINKEQSELQILVRQKNDLLRQKGLLKGNIKDKKQLLDKNNGLYKHKNHLQTQYTQTKKINQRYSSQITQLQRQVRKYHFLAQSIKNQKNKECPIIDIQNVQLELKQTMNMILNTNKQIREIEDKWKPNIDALNDEYLVLSSQEKILNQKQLKFSKELKIYEHRAKSLRDQNDIINDRSRLVKLTVVSSSLGFSQSIEKKKYNESQIRLESAKKEKIRSQFIMKELSNFKAKKPKIIKDQIQKDDLKKSSFNQNSSYMKFKDKNYKNNQQKLLNRQHKQEEFLKKLVSRKQLAKQSELKIKKKIQSNSLLKSNKLPKKSEKQRIFSQNNLSQTAINSIKEHDKSQQIKHTKNINQKSQRHSQISKSNQKINQLKEQKIVGKNKNSNALQKHHISLDKQQENKSSKIKLKNRDSFIKQKNSNQDSNKQQNAYQNKNISNKLAFNNKNQHLNAKRSKKTVSTEKNIENTKTQRQNLKIDLFKDQKKNKKRKNKQLKEVIKIQQKQLKPEIRKQKKDIDNSTQKSSHIVSQQQAQRFDINLQNKVKSQKSQQQLQKKKQIQVNQKQVITQTKNEKNITQIQKKDIKFLNDGTQITQKQEQVQVFKPYLIKRKRQGGSLNFQVSNDTGKQKQNLLLLIEKQSIGVGISEANQNQSK